jgi:hypothetical protein
MEGEAVDALEDLPLEPAKLPVLPFREPALVVELVRPGRGTVVQLERGAGQRQNPRVVRSLADDDVEVVEREGGP